MGSKESVQSLSKVSSTLCLLPYFLTLIYSGIFFRFVLGKLLGKSSPLAAGTELVGLAASETPNPRATVPGAVKGTFWRIVSLSYITSKGHNTNNFQTIIYITSLTVIGLAIPYTEDRLFGAGGGANASPFVILFDRAKIPGLNRTCSH